MLGIVCCHSDLILDNTGGATEGKQLIRRLLAFFLRNASGSFALDVNSNQPSFDFHFPDNFVSICPHKNGFSMNLSLLMFGFIHHWIIGHRCHCR